MSDIVERLCLTADWLDQSPPRSDPPQFSLVSVQREAAGEIEMLWNAVAEKNAEIERLRGLLENSDMTVKELLAGHKASAAEIERLRTALARHGLKA